MNRDVESLKVIAKRYQLEGGNISNKKLFASPPPTPRLPQRNDLFQSMMQSPATRSFSTAATTTSSSLPMTPAVQQPSPSSIQLSEIEYKECLKLLESLGKTIDDRKREVQELEAKLKDHSMQG
jgi:hypothetical protein